MACVFVGPCRGVILKTIGATSAVERIGPELRDESSDQEIQSYRKLDSRSSNSKQTDVEGFISCVTVTVIFRVV
jgi:hypothetical protein